MDTWFDQTVRATETAATRMFVATKGMRALHYLLHSPGLACMAASAILSAYAATLPPGDERIADYSAAAAVLTALGGIFTVIVTGIDAGGSSERCRSSFVRYRNVSSRIKLTRAAGLANYEFGLEIEKELEDIRAEQPVLVWMCCCSFCRTAVPTPAL
jgi:hypothetical protein